MHLSRSDLKQQAVGDLLKRCLDEFISHRRRAKTKTALIEFLLNRKLADYSLAHETPDVFRGYRDKRPKEFSSDTVKRHLAFLKQAVTVAIDKWSYPMLRNLQRR